MGNYISTTPEERKEMLSECGFSDIRDIYANVPDSVYLNNVNIASGLSELEVTDEMDRMSDANKQYKSIFRGAGAYKHFIPATVRAVCSKEEFITAYTPYQAEISQGILQSIFEYQTQICELTGMDISNASVYDGATAAAEAVFMCEERKRSGVAISAAVDPQTIEVVRTYCEARDVEVKIIDTQDGATNPESVAAIAGEVASVIIQSPNYFGIIEDAAAIIDSAHEAKAKVIMSCNPISLGLLKTPGELGADVAVGEGQPLGLPLSFGGPYLGFMATTEKMMRKLPGRIAGQTVDEDGERCFVLTLQAREQHIRREKASSNICSNQALCATTASVYLACMGPSGLEQAATSSASNAHYLQKSLEKLGFKLKHDKPFFHEFVTTCPIDGDKLESHLADRGILSGLRLDDGILWCATELNTKADIDNLVEAIKEVA